MPHHPNPTPGCCCTAGADRLWLAARIGALDIWELTTALYASRLPTRREPRTAVQLVQAAIDGMNTLGPATVRQQAQQAQALVWDMFALADRFGLVDIPHRHPGFVEHDRAWRQLWPSSRRRTLASDHALNLRSALRTICGPGPS